MLYSRTFELQRNLFKFALSQIFKFYEKKFYPRFYDFNLFEFFQSKELFEIG